MLGELGCEEERAAAANRPAATRPPPPPLRGLLAQHRPGRLLVVAEAQEMGVAKAAAHAYERVRGAKDALGASVEQAVSTHLAEALPC